MEEVISIDSLERTARSLEKRRTHQRMVRVPLRLYRARPEAYKPQFISIGPFYYPGPDFNSTKDVNLLAMEGQKRVFMLRLLARTTSKEETLLSCWNLVQAQTPERIRNCYSEEVGVPLEDELLAKIMLIDGCFLLELLLWSYEGSCFAMIENGSDFMTPMILGLRRDLALLENQIPFFVLQELYDIISPCLRSKTNPAPPDLTQMVLHFFRLPSVGQELSQNGHLHLLDLISKCHLPAGNCLDLLTNHYYHHYYRSVLDNDLVGNKSRFPLSRGVILRNATKLKEAGVIFQPTKTRTMLDLRFSHGVLHIPPLVINDCKESFLRNLLAFEHAPKTGNEYFVSYVIFMDHLIGSKEDLQLLESKGIIVNELGGREDATKFFHHISKHFVLRNFYFRHLCREIEKFCESPRQKYIQELKQRYFKSPWTALSLFAATMLLLLTTIQTVYTVLSYYHQGY